MALKMPNAKWDNWKDKNRLRASSLHCVKSTVAHNCHLDSFVRKRKKSRGTLHTLQAGKTRRGKTGSWAQTCPRFFTFKIHLVIGCINPWMFANCLTFGSSLYHVCWVLNHLDIRWSLTVVDNDLRYSLAPALCLKICTHYNRSSWLLIHGGVEQLGIYLS